MKVVVIDRECGAGGHTVGREVAKRLGVELYDRDIIAQAAEELGVSVAEVEQQEEALSVGERVINALVPNTFDLKNAVFENEGKVIIELARKGPCVILGRCARPVLEAAGIETVSVFLFADYEKRVPRMREITGIQDEAELKHVMRKRDSGRKAYYERYAGCHWGVSEEYTMSLNTGELGFDVCADIVVAAAQEATQA